MNEKPSSANANPQAHDVAVFPETGCVSVKLTGEGYRKGAVMEYWEEVNVEQA